MNTRTILSRARTAGLVLEVKKNKLRIQKKNVSPEVWKELFSLIRENKAEIIRLISGAPIPRQCLRHATLRGCIAPLVESLEFGVCVCCKTTIAADAMGQCDECNEDIRRVLGPGPDVDWSKNCNQPNESK